MCNPQGTDTPQESSNGGATAVEVGTAATIPDTLYKPSPGVVERYTHTKRVGNYLLGRELGSGSFATVREALHAVTGERVAIKIVSKETAKADAYVAKNMRREGRILQLIRHSNVVQLLEVLETENSYYLVLELVSGCDFMAHLVKRRRLTEAETRRYLRQIVQAVDYIHSLGVLHRDLKIENLLLTHEQNVKIIDFGLSNLVQAVPDKNGNIVTQLCRTQCGSPAYAAPEVLAKKAYGTAVDVWSIGVNMFAMLTGNLPFTVKPYSIKSLYQKMINQDLNPLPKTLSAGCRDLIMRLLNPQPETRIKLRDAMNHPWLNENVSRLKPSPFPNQMTREDLRPDILQQVSEQLLVPVSEVTRKVLDNSPSQCLSVYYLLVAKLDRYWRQNPVSKTQSPVRSEDLELQSAQTSMRTATASAPTNTDQLNSKSVAEVGRTEEAAVQNSADVRKTLKNEPSTRPAAEAPVLPALPRREKTIAGCVPLLSGRDSESFARLVSLDSGAGAAGDNRANGSQTARPVILPKCTTNRNITLATAAAETPVYNRQRTTIGIAERSRSINSDTKPRGPAGSWMKSERVGGRTARAAGATTTAAPLIVPPLRRIKTDSGRASSIHSLASQRYVAVPSANATIAATAAAAAATATAAAAAAAALAAAAKRPQAAISANYRAAPIGRNSSTAASSGQFFRM